MISSLVVLLLLVAPQQDAPVDSEGWLPVGPDGSVVDVVQRVRQRQLAAPHIGLPVAEPISPDDMERWSWRLRLSAAQRTYVRDKYADYLREEDEHFDAYASPLYNESAAAFETMAANNYDPLSIGSELYELVETGVPVVESHMLALEAKLFREIETGLAEGQQPALAGVIRERQRCRVTFDSRIPGSEVDLVWLLHALAVEGFDVPTMTDERLATLVERYDRELEQPCRKRYEYSVDILGRGTLAKAHKRDGVSSPLVDEVGRVRERLADVESDILAVNERFAGEFVAVLSGDAADEFLGRFRQTVYPSVHPDPTDIDPIFVELAQLELADVHRAVLREAQDVYAVRRRAVEQEMEREFSDWRAYITADGGSATVQRSDEFRAVMNELHGTRLDNARSTIALLSGQLGGTVEGASAILERWGEQLDAVTFEPDPEYCLKRR